MSPPSARDLGAWGRVPSGGSLGRQRLDSSTELFEVPAGLSVGGNELLVRVTAADGRVERLAVPTVTRVARPAHGPAGAGGEYAEGVAVRFSSSADAQAVLSGLAAGGAVAGWERAFPPRAGAAPDGRLGRWWYVRAGAAGDAALEGVLSATAGVEVAERLVAYRVEAAPNDPSLGEQYHHGMVEDRGAWEAGTGELAAGRPVKVGVLDDGFDLSHPELANRATAPLAGGTAGCTAAAGDGRAHGTAVAGLIAAEGDNGLHGGPGGEPVELTVDPQQFLQRPTPQTGTGFGQRAAVSVGADGAPTVVIADADRGSLYSYLVSPSTPATGVAFDGDPATAERVGPGATPAGMVPSAGAVSSAVGWRAVAGFEAKRVVIARDDVFADALSAAPLLDGGVLLLGPSEGPTQELLDEVERVLLSTATMEPETARVFLMGGEDALSERYQTTTLALRGVRRVAGASRVETSVEVARLVAELNGGGPVRRVGVARAYGTATDESAAWVDSVTAGGWAADTGTPLLLTGGEGLHPAVAAAVDELGVTSSVVLGGVAAVPRAAEDALPSPVRVAGSERAGTAAAIAERLWPEGTTRRLLVNAYRPDGWQYGLPAAALSAESDAPLLLTATDTLPAATREALDCGLDLLLLGDERVIKPEAEAEAEALEATSC